MVPRTIFREYDIRGLADRDLTDENVETIGRAFATWMGAQGRRRLVVARDIRLSSQRIQKALMAGLTAAGADVLDAGLVPTPVQYFAIVHLEAEGGVMVTGSHNPKEYNGLKMSTGLRGEDGHVSVGAVWGKDVQDVYRTIVDGKLASGSGKVEKVDVVPQYLAALKERLAFARPLHVVLDPGNGCGGLFAPRLWRELGCRVTCLCCEPDGTFPNHLPDPTVMKNIVDLRERVVKEGADIGIGYDGDADRLGAVDDRGRPIFADKLLTLFARDVLTRHRGAKIVFDVKCSQALPDDITAHGGVPVMSKTGHSILKMRMREENAPLAGEMSGHIYFSDGYFGFDDGIYASGRLMQILAASGRRMSELHDQIPAFISTPEIRVEATDEDKFRIVADLVKHFKKSNEVIDIDGARVLFGDGWGLVRASNTQPVLVMRFEARTEARLMEIVEVFKAKLREYPEVRFNDADFAVAE